MSETIRQHNPEELSEIYAKLNKQDIEQFYAGYQWWNVQKRFVALQEQVESLHRQIAENAELMQLFHPPAISLATMARLQASGVNDLDLLDRMLERGEDWLDRTMQRLDYCEQLDFIIDDYTQWCQNALEGAYDWIDSIREGGISDTSSSSEVPTSDTFAETTEELFLQKLTSEEEPSTPLEQVSQVSQEDQPVELSIVPDTLAKESTPPENIEPELQSVETSPASMTPVEVPTAQANVEPEAQASQPVEISPTSDNPVEATPASDISIEQSDQEDLSPAVPGDTVLESPPEDPSIAVEPLPAVEETTGEELPSATTSATSETKEPAIEEYVELATIEPAPIGASPTLDSEQPVIEEYEILRFAQDDTVEAELDPAPESEQRISQVYVEAEPAPEELPLIEENDSSDVEQFPLQGHSEDTSATEEPLDEPPTEESPTYLEESLPYRMYPPDRQPGIQANEIENAEQSTQVTTTPRRKRNFLQRLADKFRPG